MIDILVDDDIEPPSLDNARIRAAVAAAVKAADIKGGEPELCIRFASDASVHTLNRQWRDKDNVTDVLSFPMQDGPDFDLGETLGDIVIAVPFSLAEARRLERDESAHLMHLLVHGTLHLLGYDHIADDDARRMHGLERMVMCDLGLHDPYPDELPLNGASHG